MGFRLIRQPLKLPVGICLFQLIVADLSDFILYLLKGSENVWFDFDYAWRNK